MGETMGENEIFLAAQKMAAAARERFLEQACGGDQTLRERIRGRLAAWDARSDDDSSDSDDRKMPISRGMEATADHASSRALQPPAVDWEHVLSDPSVRTEPAGIDDEATAEHRFAKPAAHSGEALTAEHQIGPFTLRQRLGQGGMGEVWLADQFEPVKRQVALKVIKSGVGSKEVLARFEAERQALALMNHPNIARILDAGTTPDGQPYFAMEWVQGQPLTTFCDEHQLGIDQRLALFIDVCQGVQHAHQKGIIHRDLKPGNILVAQIDGQAVAKVIDFGLAKAMGNVQRLTDQSLFTGIGQILGTLKYMSPEQASLDAIDIDTRTDIYALGVILYELLTGSTPLDDLSIKGRAALKILELIREEEAVKPSSRLGSCSHQDLSVITRQRKTDSSRLSRILAGDMDWIVMKALEKDRTRRYESAAGFAADVQRYLNSEPIVARPPSLSYRVTKFVRKNRVAVLGATVAGLALVAGLIGTTFGLREAMRQASLAKAETVAKDAALQVEAEQRREAIRQREEADRLRHEAEQQLQRAIEAEALADARLVTSERHLAFAKKGNEVLGSVFVNLDPTAEYTTVAELRNALAENLNQVSAELTVNIGDPIVVANLQSSLGLSLNRLGKAKDAIEILERASTTLSAELGPNHKATLDSLNNLAAAYFKDGQQARALEMFEEVVAATSQLFGTDHNETLIAMSNLATTYYSAGQWVKSIELYETILKLRRQQLGPDHVTTIATIRSLAEVYRTSGRMPEAIVMAEDALNKSQAILGPSNSSTLETMNTLAVIYENAGRFEDALSTIETTIKLRTSQLGAKHPDTLTSINNLATIYRSAGNVEQTIAVLEELLTDATNARDSNRLQTLLIMSNLADAYKVADRIDQSVNMAESVLQERRELLGAEHPDTLQSMILLGNCYVRARRIDEALHLYEQALAAVSQTLGPEHPHALSCLNGLANAYVDSGKTNAGMEIFEQTLELNLRIHGATHPQTLLNQHNLGVVYGLVRKLVEAEAMLTDTLEQRQQILGATHPDTLVSMTCLATTVRQMGDPERSLKLLEEAHAHHERIHGPDHPDTLLCASNLALTYRALQQPEAAANLLTQTLEQMGTTFGPNHPVTMAAVCDLAVGYVAGGNIEKAQPLYDRVLEFLREAPRSLPHNTLLSINSLGMAYFRNQRPDLSLPVFERSLELFEASLGPEHDNTWQARHNLVTTYHAIGDLERALAACKQLLDIKRKILGEDHPETWIVMSNTAVFYEALGQHDYAFRLFEQVAEGRRAKFGADHPQTISGLKNLGWSYADADQLPKAIPIFEEILQTYRSKFGIDHPETLTAVNNVLIVYNKANQHERYIATIENVVAHFRQVYAADGPKLADFLAQTAIKIWESKYLPDAERLLRECLELRIKNQPNEWPRFQTESLLGRVLLSRLATASPPDVSDLRRQSESLLVSGYEGLLAWEATSNAEEAGRIPNALDALIELYTLLEQPQDVEKYRLLRSQYPMEGQTP
jgi:serine/threonine protein kinase/tetratricopeptide (TPR) repeat protein